MRTFISRTLILGVILILVQCSPKVNSSIKDTSLKPLNHNEEVFVISLNQSFPSDFKFVGRLKIGDTGFTTDCNYGTVIEKAKENARSVGGNVIKLTEIQPPNFSSNCYHIKADIYFANNTTAIENKLDAVQDSVSLSNFGTNPKFAILHIFRPKNFTGSAISYDIHVGDSIIYRVKNNSKFTIKLYKEGKMAVWAKTESLETITINVKFGEEYYLKCGVKTGFWAGIPEINFLDKSQGRDEFLNVENKHN